MNDQQIAERKEAARVGNRESTWFYFGDKLTDDERQKVYNYIHDFYGIAQSVIDDSEYAVTAWPEDGKVRVKTKRI